MTAFLLVLILWPLLTLKTLSCSSLNVKLSHKLFTAISENVMKPIVERELLTFPIPDITIENLALGFDLHLTELTFKSASILSSYATLDADLVSFGLSGIDAQLDGTWMLNRSSFPPLSAKGKMTVNLSKARVIMSLKALIHDGHLALPLDSIDIGIDDIQVQISESVWDWFFNLVVKLLKSLIRERVQKNVSDLLWQEIPQLLTKLCQKLPYSFSAIGLDFVYEVAKDPIISPIDGLVDIPLRLILQSGNHFLPVICPTTNNNSNNNNNNKTIINNNNEITINEKDLRLILPDKMIAIEISDNLVNCILFTLHASGKLSFPLYSSDVGNILSTGLFSYVFPKLPDLFPQHPLSLVFSSRRIPPIVSFSKANDISIDFNMNMGFYLGDRDVHRLSLGKSLQKVIGLNLDGNLGLKASSILHARKPFLVSEITNLKVSALPEFSTIGDLNIDKVNTLLRAMDKITSQISQQLLQLNTPLAGKLPSLVNSSSLEIQVREGAFSCWFNIVF